MERVLVRSRGARHRLAIRTIVSGLIVVAGWTSAAAQDDNNKLPGVYAMDADGGNFRLLVKLEGKWNGSPKFSPDGKKLLFDASPEGRNFAQGHVYMVAAGGPADNPTDLGLGSNPAWSPDGKQIAFYVHNGNPDNAEPGVWIMNADGSERLWMCYGRVPQFSPDGKRLVLVNNPNGTGDGLYLYNLEKNESEAVLDRTYEHIGGAAWSPDGKRLALIANPGVGGELVIVTVEGDDRSERVRLAGRIGWRPNWSPDGKYIVCWIVSQDDQLQLHRVEADTNRDPERLAHQDQGRINSDASWSTDGTRIVFMSDR
jgi:Tol biopolymer transport system component